MNKMLKRLLVPALAAGITACSGPEGDGADGGTNNGTNGEGTNNGTNDGRTNNGTNGSHVVTNGCGTFDLSLPGDLVVPEDPDTPAIVEACTDWCDALLTVEDCPPDDREACIEDCKQESCRVCPDTWAPVVECRVEHFDAARCTCEPTGVECPPPADCDDEQSATGHCGG